MTKLQGVHPYYSRASVKIHNVLILSMNLEGLTYRQQLYKVDLLRQILRTLRLRKRPNQNIWEMRIGGRWINHTSIVLVE